MEYKDSIRRRGNQTKTQAARVSSPTSKPALRTELFGDLPIVFREDGWIRITKVPEHFGKRLGNFWANKESSEYLETLSKHTGIPVRMLKVTKGGRGGGTFLHPKLAVRVARWMNMDFEVWCDLMIDNILRGNIQTTVVVPTKEAVDVESVVAPWKAQVLALTERKRGPEDCPEG